MKRLKRLSLLLPGLLLFSVACGKSNDEHTAKTADGPVEVGVVDTIYQVLNEMDRERVGFVNVTSYNSGRVVYWVYGPDYNAKLGYVLADNRAVKYVWRPGDKRAVEEALVSDTRNSSVRRILENEHVIVLEKIDARALAAEKLGDRYAKPAPAKTDDGCGCGCGE